jgi:hypothetical protein
MDAATCVDTGAVVGYTRFLVKNLVLIFWWLKMRFNLKKVLVFFQKFLTKVKI